MAPVVAHLQSQLQALTQGVDAATLQYLAGFLAGIAAERARNSPAAATSAATSTAAQSATRATVLYASQTGNGRRIAEKLHRQLESQGLTARLVNAADYKNRDLSTERLLYLVVSTHGDGDPPDDVRPLVDFLAGRKAPQLPELSYSILALGDSSYPKFCETGRMLDERLGQLGAKRLADRVNCDVDFQASADSWSQQALTHAREHLQSPHIAVISTRIDSGRAADRDAPTDAQVLATARISARSSDHPVTHIELSAPADRLAYEPGDAVGIWHENPRWVAQQIAQRLDLSLDTPVALDGAEHSLAHWLQHKRDITRLARPFLDAHAQHSTHAELQALCGANNPEALRSILRDWQPLDLLEKFPASWTAKELVQALRPLTPRLYSIASSRLAVGDEMHLTVAAVDYVHAGQRRVGAASHFLTNFDSTSDTPLRAYIEPNPRFRLPADTARDIVMIGPGTGVAPFRGFLQHRVESGARGRNWLFFGARHLYADFLYQSEWLDARRVGTLHRLDVAFSRDQVEKIYVQQRIREQGAELARWIEGGAHIYVCGDAQRMASDVHAALIDVLVSHTGRDAESAGEFLSELAAQRRYARDVY